MFQSVVRRYRNFPVAKCSFCNATILFGGQRDGDLRFCSAKCLDQGYQFRLAQRLPPEMVDEAVQSVFEGACPKCGGPGPVDVHMSYRVISFLKFTSWSTRTALCCTGCGRKAKLLDALYSFAFGWWGVPLGFIVTPIQIARNLMFLVPAGTSSSPSAALEKAIRVDLAGEVLRSNREARARERLPEIVGGEAEDV